MRVNLDSIPSQVISLLQKNVGGGYLHRKVYLDTINKRTICIGPSYVYIFEGLEFENADNKLYGIPYDVFKLGLEEGIMDVFEHKIKIGSMAVAVERTFTGDGTFDQVTNAVENVYKETKDIDWQDLDATSLDSLKEARKFVDAKSDRSYVYINNNLMTALHGNEFFTVFEVNTPYKLALSSKASELLVSSLESLEIFVKKDNICLRSENFIGITSNYTHGSYRFEDLPTKELIDSKLSAVDTSIIFDKTTKMKFKRLLTVLSDHIKNQNLVIKFTSGGFYIEDARLSKVLGMVDDLEWSLDNVWSFDLQIFLRLYSLLDSFTISAPSTEGINLGLIETSNKKVLIPVTISNKEH